jgi:phosphoribosyl-ATP pyrophosphohydrolase
MPAKKLGEEGVEVALAGVAEDPSRLTEESADLLYHLLVLLRVRSVRLRDVIAELERRHRS